MKTVVKINKAKQYLNERGYGKGNNFTFHEVAKLMVEWSEKGRSSNIITNCEAFLNN